MTQSRIDEIIEKVDYTADTLDKTLMLAVPYVGMDKCMQVVEAFNGMVEALSDALDEADENESIPDILDDAAYTACRAINGEIGKGDGYEAVGRIIGVAARLRDMEKEQSTC